MMVRDGETLRLEASITTANARVVQAAALPWLGQAGAATIDLSGVGEADSSALAVLLSWQRLAGERGATLRYIHTPAGLRALARLYGLESLLSLQ